MSLGAVRVGVTYLRFDSVKNQMSPNTTTSKKSTITASTDMAACSSRTLWGRYFSGLSTRYGRYRWDVGRVSATGKILLRTKLEVEAVQTVQRDIGRVLAV